MSMTVTALDISRERGQHSLALSCLARSDCWLNLMKPLTYEGTPRYPWLISRGVIIAIILGQMASIGGHAHPPQSSSASNPRMSEKKQTVATPTVGQSPAFASSAPSSPSLSPPYEAPARPYGI